MGQCVCFGKTDQVEEPDPAAHLPSTISIDELRRATGGFTDFELVGEGASAHVFMGTLGSSRIIFSETEQTGQNEQAVAVKRLKRAADRDAEYVREISMLSPLDHPHIINLVGCCAHRDEERIIVCEFMPMRTLKDWLRDHRAALDWGTRMRIGAGVAKGLSYLHNQAIPRVIYRDLRPTHVLLDVGHHPKISDFRGAISDPSSGQSPSSVLRGTHPYWAPEASNIDTVTPKADVFSFGVLFLEIIHGSVPLDPVHNRFVHVKYWVTRPENYYQVPDLEMNGEFPLDECVKAMTLVNHCMKYRPFTRPDMSVVEQGMRNLAGEPDADWPDVFNTEEEQAESSSRNNQG